GGVVRRPRLYLAVALPLAIPILLATVNVDPGAMPAATPPAPPLRYADLVAVPTAELPEHSVILTLDDGDTLDAVLSEGGLSRSDSAYLTNHFGESIDLRRLRPGHLLRFHYDGANQDDSVEMKVVGW